MDAKITKEQAQEISIHALRVEGDDTGTGETGCYLISIHALRVEGDKQRTASAGDMTLFLSTPSGWRATASDTARPKSRYISIHALRVEGDLRLLLQAHCLRISIHALRVEGDVGVEPLAHSGDISIHALRVEGDSKNGQSFRLFLRKREKNLPL